MIELRRARIFNFECKSCKAEGVPVFFDNERCEKCDGSEEHHKQKCRYCGDGLGSYNCHCTGRAPERVAEDGE